MNVPTRFSDISKWEFFTEEGLEDFVFQKVTNRLAICIKASGHLKAFWEVDPKAYYGYGPDCKIIKLNEGEFRIC